MGVPAWKGKVLDGSKKSEESEESEVLEGGDFSGKGQRPASGLNCNYLHTSILGHNNDPRSSVKMSNMSDLLGFEKLDWRFLEKKARRARLSMQARNGRYGSCLAN